jgi:hypothetical protein
MLSNSIAKIVSDLSETIQNNRTLLRKLTTEIESKKKNYFLFLGNLPAHQISKHMLQALLIPNHELADFLLLSYNVLLKETEN